MSIESLIVFAAAMVVFGLTPGPVIVTTVARCLAGGFRAGVALNFGVVVSDVIFLVLAVYGMSWIAEQAGPAFLVVRWAGAAYLVWLGVQLWRSRPVAVDAAAVPALAPRGRWWRDLLGGLLLGLGNPKAILFYGALLPTFFDLTRVTHLDIVWLSLIIVAALTLVNNGYGLLASQARRWLRSERAMRRLNRGAGTVMIGAGVVVAAR